MMITDGADGVTQEAKFCYLYCLLSFKGRENCENKKSFANIIYFVKIMLLIIEIKIL